jgi:hypothetical protein
MKNVIDNHPHNTYANNLTGIDALLMAYYQGKPRVDLAEEYSMPIVHEFAKLIGFEYAGGAESAIFINRN